MSNLHRLIWIDAQIRAGQYPNSRLIAAHFEISGRQAARDIEYLRDTMGAPLVYVAKAKGYSYAEPTFVLPGYLLSEREDRALSDLAFQYQNSGSAQAMEIAELFRRLTARVAHPGKSGKDAAFAGYESPEVMPAKIREPFVALIQFAQPLQSGQLKMPCRIVADGTCEIEFYDSATILAALLALPQSFTILAPRWLRERLHEKLAQILKDNTRTSYVIPPPL